ncbi:MAG: diguanylate cyclase [Psychromonas sp.]
MPSTIPNHNAVVLSVTKLRQRYTIALSLIALLIIISQIIIQFVIAAQIHDSHIVNIAGRQRMLSQKITKLSYYVSTAESEDAASRYRTELKDATDLWENSHLGLIHGNNALELPGNNSKEITALFDSIQLHYKAVLNAAKVITFSFDISEVKQNVHKILQHESDFLKGMDKIVFQYDREAIAKVTSAKWLEITLMVVTLTVLILEAVFIFSPATKSLQHSMQILTQREQDLQNLFAASPTAMLLIDPANFSIIKANRKAQMLIGDPFGITSPATLQTYLDPKYESNNLFINKLKEGNNLNEYELVILNAHGTALETLASVRVITFDGKSVSVLGITNISELKNVQQQLQHYASFDEMTGLLNRRTGLMFLDKSMKQLNRSDGRLSICYIDIDGLKYANDQYGHSEGDWLINTVSQAFINIIRTSDAAVRLGGDEFLLILHNCSKEDAKHLIVRAETYLKEKEAAEHKPFPIGFSYGIATYTANRDITADELISEADNLMYQSKHTKKSQS